MIFIALYLGEHGSRKSHSNTALLGVSQNEDRKNKFKKTFPGIIRELIKNPRYFSLTCLPAMVEGYLFANEHGVGSKILGYTMDRIQTFRIHPMD